MRKKRWSVGQVAHLGGAATRDKLTAEQRKASARRAALARWEKTPKPERSEGARKAVLARWAKAAASKVVDGQKPKRAHRSRRKKTTE